MTHTLCLSGSAPAPGRRIVLAPCTLVLVCAAVVALAVLCAGCVSADDPIAPPPAAAAGPTYTGPTYLRGTVGSLARVRNFQPTLVSGFGLVVGLRGTGSNGVPAYLRQHMIQMLRKRGFGSARLGTEYASPQRVLADPDTAVVSVFGLVPPGASKGARFDVLARALEGTQTTSLVGGDLYMTDLSFGGVQHPSQYTTPLAKAHGSIYLNPEDQDAQRQANAANAASGADGGPGGVNQLQRQGLVIGGGEAIGDRRVDLILNQPSYNRSRIIADRINERFPAAPEDPAQTAVAKSDLLVQINIPGKWSADPRRLLELIANLYTQRAPYFEPRQARELAQVLADNPETRGQVVLAWEALGKTIYPVLREHYDDSRQDIRLAALEAGAWLGDERTSTPLREMAGSEDAQTRIDAARALAYLPQSIQGERALRQLLDDPETDVRVAAYQALADGDAALLDRVAVRDEQGVKYIIDRVPVDKPLLYITPEGVPRLVIFNPQLAFQTPLLARLWDLNRIILRQSGPDQLLELFHIPRRPANEEEASGKTYQLQPTVATLAYMLGHQPTVDRPAEGLDLSFSEVVNILYRLQQEGHIDAPIRVRASALAQTVQRAQQQNQQQQVRPDTVQRVDSAGPDSGGGSGGGASQVVPGAGENPDFDRDTTAPAQPAAP